LNNTGIELSFSEFLKQFIFLGLIIFIESKFQI
jgi:hypothetical protein